MTGAGPAPSPLRNPEFRNLLAVSVTVAIGFGMVVPVLPLYAKSFGVGLATAGLVQLVFGLTRFSFGLVGGLVVDRFGERACAITGLLVVAASSYAAGFAGTFTQLVLARGFGGAGSALFIAGLMNRMLRIIEPEAMGRASGISRSSFLVGIGIGPVLGGVAASAFGLAAPFHFYATGLLVAALIAWRVMGGAGPSRGDGGRTPLAALRAAVPLLRDFRYIVALLATLAGWWTLSGPAQFVGAAFADDVLAFDERQIGLAVTLLSAGEIVVLFAAGRASDRLGRRAVMVPSLAIAATATAALGQVGPGAAWLFYPTMIAIGSGVAASSTASGGLLADAVAGRGSGTAVGVNQMAGDLGYLVAPTALGAIAQGASFELAYVAGAVPAAVAFAVALWLPRRDRSAARPIEAIEPLG